MKKDWSNKKAYKVKKSEIKFSSTENRLIFVIQPEPVTFAFTEAQYKLLEEFMNN